MGKKKTHEEFVKEVYSLVGDEYTVIGNYEDGKTKIKVRHNNAECDFYEYSVKPRYFLNGNRCPACAERNRKIKITKTHDQFIKEVIEIHGDNYEFLTEYIGSTDCILVKHKLCDYIWEATPVTFLRKRYKKGKLLCANCNGCGRMDTDKFKSKVFELTGNKYSVIGEYVNTITPILMIHNADNCKHQFEVIPNTFIHDGYECPKCFNNIPKGELKILEVLSKNDIRYEHQYKFKDCRNINPLPFDFAIFHNTEMNILIEYDSEIHFKSVDFFGGDKTFESRKKHDQIKNQYCKENNIKLYRIPYWYKDRIEEILNKLIYNEHVGIDENFMVKL